MSDDQDTQQGLQTVAWLQALVQEYKAQGATVNKVSVGPLVWRSLLDAGLYTHDDGRIYGLFAGSVLKVTAITRGDSAPWIVQVRVVYPGGDWKIRAHSGDVRDLPSHDQLQALLDQLDWVDHP